MKIGIFGGVFDPIHVGHLITVEEVREQLKLGKVLFIPTYNPSHKKTLVSYKHRCNMVELAIQNNPYFELCEIEKERGGKSWTIETLKELYKRYPYDKLYLIIGSDQYLTLNTWKEPRNLTRYAKLVVMERPKVSININTSNFCMLADITQIDIASKNIRKNLKQTKSIRYKVTEEVYNYIKNKKLYK